MNEDISIRFAENKDCRFIYDIRNSPDVRKISLNSDDIKFEDHEKWFNSALKNYKIIFFIILDKNNSKIGYSRFNINDNDAEISIALHKNYRGKGFGTISIIRSCETLFNNYNITKIIAKIKPENQGSKKAFTKSGFNIISSEDIEEYNLGNPALKLDCSIILSHELDENGIPSIDTQNRISKGLELLDDNRTNLIILSGGYCYKDKPYSVAKAMEKHISKTRDTNKIILEEKSKDTVGQAVFTRDIIINGKFKNIAIITSNYHIFRTKKIFDKIIPSNVNILYLGVNSSLDENIKVLEKEKKSLKVFNESFGQFEFKDQKKIEEKLRQNHPLYKE